MHLTEVVTGQCRGESLIGVCLGMNWKQSLETRYIKILKIFATNGIVASRVNRVKRNNFFQSRNKSLCLWWWK